MAAGRRAAGIAMVLAGLGLLASAAARGEVRVGLFLVIPYVYGGGILPFLGFTLLLVGSFLWLTSGVPAAPPEGRAQEHVPPGGWEESRRDASAGGARRRRHGGFVLLGPIPLVWGSDKRMLPWLVAAALGLFLMMLVLPGLLAR